MRTPVMALLAFVVVVPARALAQDCGCDHRLELEVTEADGAELGVGPGERVCVMAGAREFLRLRGFVGSADAPVTIVNCGGVVEIRNEERAYALVVEGDSAYFHLTGTGDAAHPYGFRVSAPDTEPWPGVGLWLLGRSTNYEVDHVEVFETGFAGVSAKTDPLCDGSADQGVFVQRDVELHHLWVHDTGGEGFYVGSTQADGQTITCDGVEEVHQPHFLDGISIHHTLVERTGWDGIQVGMARSGCSVSRNVIRQVGLALIEYQQQGLQIGTYSACDVRENVIEDGPANGIIVLGAGPTTIASNLIVGFAGDGVYANHQDRVEAAGYRFLANTIAAYGRNAVTMFGPGAVGSEAVDNLVIGAAPGIAAGSDVPWRSDHDLVVADEAIAGVVGGGDYHLLAGSPARGAGVALAEVPTDLDGRTRADPPAVGAYEFVDDAPVEDGGPDEPDADLPADADPPADADLPADADADAPDDADAPRDVDADDAGGPAGGDAGGGCGCAAARPAGAAPVLLAALAAFGAISRRR